MVRYTDLNDVAVDGVASSSFQGQFLGMATQMPAPSQEYENRLLLYGGSSSQYVRYAWYTCRMAPDGTWSWVRQDLAPPYSLEPLMAVQSDADGEVASSDVSATELSRLRGVRSSVQEQIDRANPVKRKLFRNALAIGRRYNIDYLSRGLRPPLQLKLEYEMMNRTVFSLVRHELGLEHANIFPTAGATVSAHVEEFVHSIGLNMIVGYGLTESLATVSCDRLGEPYTVGSVGKPIDGLDVRISDEGEIQLKGPTITRGYYNRPELTRDAFTADGFFRTGDAGYMKGGELFLTERIKDLFKTSNGKYIAPQAIESRLLVDKFIDQIAIIADQRKFVSALIIPEYRLVEEFARANGIPFESREDLCANAKVQQMMMDRITTLQQQLAHYEQVKRITLLPHHFSMERGELTNTLKLKRRVINENYKAEIDRMYEES